MKRYYWFLAVSVILFSGISGCKSAKKSLKKGNFDEAVFLAVEKLADSPTHSGSLATLKEAYPNALNMHLDEIKRHHLSASPYKYEFLVHEYKALNALFEAINKCGVCARQVDARPFRTEENEARTQAADARYFEGESFLAAGGRVNARKAFDSFEKVKEFVPAYRDIERKLDMSYEDATFKVVVEQVLVTSKLYQLSNEYFQSRINEFLRTNKRLNKFVQFYTPEEAVAQSLRPDHVVVLQFDDFVVGQTLLEKNTETVTSKDSVKVGETTVNKVKVPVYNRVTAKLTISRKTVHSGGLLDMRIEDFATRNRVSQEKFTGEYNWVCEWGNFNGDERALTPAQLRICRVREQSPPPPQQLFVEFNKPLYDRVTSRLRAFYASY